MTCCLPPLGSSLRWPHSAAIPSLDALADQSLALVGLRLCRAMAILTLFAVLLIASSVHLKSRVGLVLMKEAGAGWSEPKSTEPWRKFWRSMGLGES